MRTLVTLCARGGSKGVPGKNIRLLAGKPLIVYSIEKALQFSQIFPDTDITLSTDDETIRSVSAEFGLITNYTRPEFLSGDDAGKVVTIEHILLHEEQKRGVLYDLVLDLDVSAPFRSIADLTDACKLILDDPEALNLFSVSAPNKNPYFNMVELNSNGYYSLVKEPDSKFMTRQSAPKVYDINASFYLYRRSFFNLGFKSVITPRSLAFVCNHISFDIDKPLDFEIMEYLILNNKLDFTF